MKIEISLPEKPSFLHMLPLIDLLALVMLFPMLTSALTTQAGVELELPETSFRLQRIANPVVVSITGGVEPQFWVGKQKVERGELLNVVKFQSEKWKGGGAPAVLLKVDKTSQSYGTEISYQLLGEGYRCLLAANLAKE